MSKTTARNAPGRTTGRVVAVTAGDCMASGTAPAQRVSHSRSAKSLDGAQPNRGVVRLKRVIVKRMLHPDRRLALEFLLRGVAAALAAVLILGLLPAITEAAA